MAQPVILVAEDERIIGYDLCDTVEEAGYRTEGPYGSVDEAMKSVSENPPSLAILDVELEGGKVYPLAEKLIADHVPVIFYSGRASRDELKARFPEVPAVSKPCPPDQMLERVAKALESA